MKYLVICVMSVFHFPPSGMRYFVRFYLLAGQVQTQKFRCFPRLITIIEWLVRIYQ